MNTSWERSYKFSLDTYLSGTSRRQTEVFSVKIIRFFLTVSCVFIESSSWSKFNSIQYVVCLHKYSNFCYLTGFTRNLEINRTDFWVLAGVWGLGLVQRQSKDPHKHLRRNALQEQLTAKRCSLLLQSSRSQIIARAWLRLWSKQLQSRSNKFSLCDSNNKIYSCKGYFRKATTVIFSWNIIEV